MDTLPARQSSEQCRDRKEHCCWQLICQACIKTAVGVCCAYVPCRTFCNHNMRQLVPQRVHFVHSVHCSSARFSAPQNHNAITGASHRSRCPHKPKVNQLQAIKYSWHMQQDVARRHSDGDRNAAAVHIQRPQIDKANTIQDNLQKAWLWCTKLYQVTGCSAASMFTIIWHLWTVPSATFHAALLQGLCTESAATHSTLSAPHIPMLQLLNQMKALKWLHLRATQGTTCGGP